MKKKKAALIACISALVIALGSSVGYIIYKQYYIPAKNEETYSDLRDLHEQGELHFPMKLETPEQEDSSQPGETQANEPEIEPVSDKYSGTEKQETPVVDDNNIGSIDWGSSSAPSYQIGGNVIGWLTIPDTSINYPVMYIPHSGNYYLYHNCYGYWDQFGSIFLDGEQKVDAKCMTLFGHNMNSYYAGMFRELRVFENSYFFDNHRYLSFDIGSGSSDWEVVGCMIYNVYSNQTPLSRTSFLSDDDFITYANSLYNQCYLRRPGTEFNKDDQLLLLVTCSYYTANCRTVVVCRRV